MLQAVFFAVLLSFGFSEEMTPARLLVHKSTPTDPVVEGKDFLITYNLYNTGGRAAKGIELTDKYDSKSFIIKGVDNEEGVVTFNVDEVGPGEHKTVNITIIAKLYGMYESTRAVVRYTSASEEDSEDTESEEDHFNALSSALPRTKILSNDEYQRVSSYYARDWVVFVVLAAVTTAIPYATWKAKNAEIASWSKGKRKHN